MKIKDIIKVTNGKLIKGEENAEIKEFCKDTRIIKKGDTYIGIKGENFDGNTLWQKAFEAGAETVIVEGIDFSKENLEQYQNKNIIEVKDTIQALADIATYKRTSCKKRFSSCWSNRKCWKNKYKRHYSKCSSTKIQYIKNTRKQQQ